MLLSNHKAYSPLRRWKFVSRKVKKKKRLGTNISITLNIRNARINIFFWGWTEIAKEIIFFTFKKEGCKLSYS